MCDLGTFFLRILYLPICTTGIIISAHPYPAIPCPPPRDVRLIWKMDEGELGNLKNLTVGRVYYINTHLYNMDLNLSS